MREDKVVCAYCGKEKVGGGFVIGASLKPDWTMVNGTGKMTCPDCYDKAVSEGQAKIQCHVASINNGV